MLFAGPNVPELETVRQARPAISKFSQILSRRPHGEIIRLPWLLRGLVPTRDQLHIDLVIVLYHEMIDVHVAVETSNNDVAILLEPERVFLPASLIPTVLAWGSGGRYMAHQDGLHAALPEKLQLYPQPLEVLVPRLRLGGTTVDSIVRIEEV